MTRPKAQATRAARWWLLAASLAACGCYRGGARPADPSALRADRDWVVLPRMPEVLQAGERDCGAAAAAMVLGYWGIPAAQAEIRAASDLPAEQALSAGFLRAQLRSRGLQAWLLQGTLLDLERELKAGRPVLVGVVKAYTTASYAHYQVVVGLNRAAKRVAVIDPAVGWREYAFEAFAQEWHGAQELMLVAIPPARL